MSTAVTATTATTAADVDEFASTYLHGSTKTTTNTDSLERRYLDQQSALPEIQGRTLSTDSRDSLDLGDPEKEADKFLNQLNSKEPATNMADADFRTTTTSENFDNQNESEISELQFDDLRESTTGEIGDKFSMDINENVEFHHHSNTTKSSVYRHESLNKDRRLNVIREGLIQSGHFSRSVNDLSKLDAYRLSYHHPSNNNKTFQNHNNHRHNRFDYHDDFNIGHKTGPLFSGNQRDGSMQSNKRMSHKNAASCNNLYNQNNDDENKTQLNTLQEKYSQAINDFKILRSTLTENMERNLLRTEQIDQLKTKTSHENIYRNNTASFETPSSTSSLGSSRGDSFQGQPNIASSTSSDVVYRNKTNSGLERFSSQERLFQRFSDMNLEEKFGNANYNQQFPQQQQQHPQHPQHQQQQQQQQQQHIGTNNNYEMKGGYAAGYSGKTPELQLSTNEQNREYQSQLRDQAAKSNFERYLKGSFNAHHTFEQTNHMEDPGYGGSGSTSPREMDTLMTSDRFSSRSGSVASRQSQCSAVASVDSGVRMSYVGQHNSLVVVAIDFGTTFSGYAFSFTRDSSSVHMMRRWEGGDPGVTNQKTPTTLLLKPDGTFHSFGFGARDFYHDLDVNESRKWMYFDKFKMTLHGSEDLNSGVEIRAANGKSYPALKVFSHALRFFKHHVLAELSDQSTAKLSEEDITWVVTVPAIWKQPAKQFMRTAAYEAGITSINHPDRLLIALEPEAASIFCRKLRIRDCVIEDDLKAKAGDDSLISEDFEGITQYIVVDCGGGTVDLTVHELDVTQGTLKELHKGTGGPSGATGVDREFEKLLKRIFDSEFIERFKVKRPAAWIDLMISFEAKKRTARPDNQSPLNISLPFSFIEYHKKHRKCTVETAIKKYKNPDIKWSSQGMLRFSAGVMQTLFEPVMNEIIGHIQNLLMKPTLKHVEHLFLVGGFAESPLLQSIIRESLDGRVRVIIPNDVGLAILKGAVLFGLDPTVVRVRRSAYTYGVGVLNKFDTEKHDQSKRVIKDGVVWCKDIFDCFVRVDESMGVGDRVTRSYAPARSKQLSTVINIYCTEKSDVLYTTDKGVTKCGKLRIEMPEVPDMPIEKRGKPRELQASMIFGDTEIKVSAVDVMSGKAARATIDFLNY